jgi:nucleoside-diphosphate kinase
MSNTRSPPTKRPCPASSVMDRSVPFTRAEKEFGESPFSCRRPDLETKEEGIKRNQHYLDWCRWDSAARGYLLVDSHGSMTRHPLCPDFFVSDYDPAWNLMTRKVAVDLAHNIRAGCARTVFYVDRGWSPGMKAAKAFCKKHGLDFEERHVNVALIMEKFPNINRFGTAILAFNAVVDDTQDYTRFMPGEYTVGIIKPDAFKYRFSILHQVQHADPSITARVEFTVEKTLTKAEAEAHYAEHKDKPFFPGLIKHMTSGPCLIFLLTTGKNRLSPAWQYWRGYMQFFRCTLGTGGPKNAVHGSDSVNSAGREVQHLLKDKIRAQLKPENDHSIAE